MKSRNPALGDRAFERIHAAATGEVMTVQGAVTRTGILAATLFASAAYTWHTIAGPNGNNSGLSIGVGMIGGLVVALVTIFVPRISPWTAPLYAVLEGMALGAISWTFEARYPGVPGQAVLATLGALAAMLVLYRTGLVRVTDRFRSIMLTAILGVVLVYVLNLVLGFFGTPLPIVAGGGMAATGFSLLVVGIASFSLLLDFDAMERAAAAGAPRYYEWYTAFGLLVGLVWLYLELLRLLGRRR